mmetsp:Transcript_147066/g.472286  ORF Transcript_147066/g.472286 Transcript_147066/m.472286 type:complete len:243 (+) Transcript_147066:219-947(+)
MIDFRLALASSRCRGGGPLGAPRFEPRPGRTKSKSSSARPVGLLPKSKPSSARGRGARGSGCCLSEALSSSAAEPAGSSNFGTRGSGAGAETVRVPGVPGATGQAGVAGATSPAGCISNVQPGVPGTAKPGVPGATVSPQRTPGGCRHGVPGGAPAPEKSARPGVWGPAAAAAAACAACVAKAEGSGVQGCTAAADSQTCGMECRTCCSPSCSPNASVTKLRRAAKAFLPQSEPAEPPPRLP